MLARTKPAREILLVVSDPLVRAVFQDTLERAGYTVVPASNLGNAVDRLKTNKPDLLIIRSYVSDMPGHSAANYLRSRCPALPVLMVGGQMDDERLTSRNALVAFHVFPKPFAPAQFLEAVEQALNAHVS
jgi:CheY-like chemotaxis protein